VAVPVVACLGVSCGTGAASNHWSDGMSVNDGGPAFPHKPSEEIPVTESIVRFVKGDEPGMTLRDYFAAKAMQALIAKGMDNTQNRNKAGVPVIAGFAYEYADAMLKARES
jgi:hypothetical protein